LPFDTDVEATEALPGAPGLDPNPGRKVGRPRKWATEAERKRAYRERLAADLAEPQRLRRELRDARRKIQETDTRLSGLERELAAAQAEIKRRSRRETELQATVERLEERVADWRSRAQELARSLEVERESRASVRGSPGSSVPSRVTPRPPKKGSKRRRGR
jgi:predicted RNase H-like nuclease (RuvC/YqgF family)